MAFWSGAIPITLCATLKKPLIQHAWLETACDLEHLSLLPAVRAGWDILDPLVLRVPSTTRKRYVPHRQRAGLLPRRHAHLQHDQADHGLGLFD
jgi:hypothetical protein